MFSSFFLALVSGWASSSLSDDEKASGKVSFAARFGIVSDFCLETGEDAFCFDSVVDAPCFFLGSSFSFADDGSRLGFVPDFSSEAEEGAFCLDGDLFLFCFL